mmetsp:Transcript_37134/g.112110  ORF Transcript_37134/g.112110 Transcript_37134/m.112110 type:complete len:262 (+) Transcript_37134:1559-2344(+)
MGVVAPLHVDSKSERIGTRQKLSHPRDCSVGTQRLRPVLQQVQRADGLVPVAAHFVHCRGKQVRDGEELCQPGDGSVLAQELLQRVCTSPLHRDLVALVLVHGHYAVADQRYVLDHLGEEPIRADWVPVPRPLEGLRLPSHPVHFLNHVVHQGNVLGDLDEVTVRSYRVLSSCPSQRLLVAGQFVQSLDAAVHHGDELKDAREDPIRAKGVLPVVGFFQGAFRSWIEAGGSALQLRGDGPTWNHWARRRDGDHFLAISGSV